MAGSVAMDPAKDLTNVTLGGRYRLTRLIGEGGMGQVYEGIHETLDRKVAVKVLLPRYAYEAKFRERFLREAKAASKVRHPNVVQILDFGDTPQGSVYFAMEYLEGQDLQSILQHEGRLSWARTRHMMLQVTSAIGAAHERSVIHRDIKPANVLVISARGHQEFVKVLDFGIAKIGAESGENTATQGLTGTGEVFGTAKYMAPEQAFGSSDDPRVDVYSLGVVAYQMLTGDVPFTGSSAFEILTRHVNEPPRPPTELNPAVPPEVESVILRALAKSPIDRFATVDEMGTALEAISPGALGVGEASPFAGPAPSSHVPQPIRVTPSNPIPMPTPAALASPPVSTMPASTVPAPAPQVPAAVGQPQAPVVQAPPQDATMVAPAPSASDPGFGPVVPAAGMTAAPMHPSGGHPAASNPGGPVQSAGGESGELGAGVSTSRLHRTLDSGGATSPVMPGMTPGYAPETDPHAVLSPPGSNRPKIIAGGVIAVLLGGLTAVVSVGSSEDDEQPKSKSTAGPVATVIEPRTLSEPAVSDDGGVVASKADVGTPEVEVVPEPAPTPVAKPTPKRNSPKSSASSAPLTDKRAKSKLARKLERKCKGIGGPGTVSVELLVGSSGSVLSKTIAGVSSSVKSCLKAGITGAKFPTGSTARKVTFTVKL